MAQHPLLFQRSVRTNLRDGRRQRAIRDEERIEWALARVGLAVFAARHAGRLSGGERPRVSIARAITLDTAVVLLDEPTANVGSQTSTAIEGLVRDLAANGRCVILSAPDPAQAQRLGGEIVALDQGRPVTATAGDGHNNEVNR